MNFAQKTVDVFGHASERELIKAVAAVGYHAQLIEQDSTELLDEKDKAEAAYYKRLMKEMAIALVLGVPLMLYSIFVGEMTVSTDLERTSWLIVGLLTLGIMYFSGRHFYVGAWKSFLNHSASMDTLIALGTATAWLYSMVVVLAPEAVPLMARHVYFEATAMIIGLIDLGLALEIKARGRTSEAIKRLIGLQAKTARVLRDGEEIDLPIAEVVLDDQIRCVPARKYRLMGLSLKAVQL
jgi:Cu+-exporting ATPase